MPRHCYPSPQGAKYITVTQDTSPSGVVEVCNQYLFGQAKTRSLGQVMCKAKNR